MDQERKGKVKNQEENCTGSYRGDLSDNGELSFALRSASLTELSVSWVIRTENITWVLPRLFYLDK